MLDNLLEGLKFGIGLAIPILVVTCVCYSLIKNKYEQMVAERQKLENEENKDYRFIASTIIRPPNVIRCDTCFRPVERTPERTDDDE